MSYKSFLSSKLTIVLLLALLGFLGNVKYRQWKVEQTIAKEKQILTEQAEAQQKKQDELNRSLSYLNSSSFKERVARQELGLKKEGEVVYGFTENPILKSAGTAPAGKEKRSNLAKWWDYFVNNN